MPSPPTLKSPPALQTAARALSTALTHTKYALVGGGACTMLGSARATEDIDIAVPTGQTACTRQLLRASREFTVEARTNYTTHKDTGVEITILAPPRLFREVFDEGTEVVVVDGVKVLRPALVLDSKCGAVFDRASERKKGTEAADILFLLGYCAEHEGEGALPRREEMKRARREFVSAFVELYGNQQAWIRAGFDWESGLWGGNTA